MPLKERLHVRRVGIDCSLQQILVISAHSGLRIFYTVPDNRVENGVWLGDEDVLKPDLFDISVDAAGRRLGM
jgi:hypothetical protein